MALVASSHSPVTCWRHLSYLVIEATLGSALGEEESHRGELYVSLCCQSKHEDMKTQLKDDTDRS